VRTRSELTLHHGGARRVLCNQSLKLCISAQPWPGTHAPLAQRELRVNNPPL
jgi:hypothetical protein